MANSGLHPVSARTWSGHSPGTLTGTGSVWPLIQTPDGTGSVSERAAIWVASRTGATLSEATHHYWTVLSLQMELITDKANDGLSCVVERRSFGMDAGRKTHLISASVTVQKVTAYMRVVFPGKGCLYHTPCIVS